MRHRLSLALLLAILAIGAAAQTTAPTLPSGIHRATVLRSDATTLTYYANFEHLDSARPLALWLQGSGYHSVLPLQDGQLQPGFLALVAETLGPEVQVLAVEKRGVVLGAVGTGAGLEAPSVYHEYATLEDRARDIAAVLAELERKAPLPARVLAIGHSEGADVAAKVAADCPQVSHLAFLSGGGASQLFDLMVVIRKSEASLRDQETQIEELWRQWEDIRSDPTSTTKMLYGHAYRRWWSYITQPPLESLQKTKAKILIIHGSSDRSVPIESADAAAVELSRTGKSFEYLRLPDADHSLRTPEQAARGVTPLLPLSVVLRRFFLE